MLLTVDLSTYAAALLLLIKGQMITAPITPSTKESISRNAGLMNLAPNCLNPHPHRIQSIINASCNAMALIPDEDVFSLPIGNCSSCGRIPP